MPVPVRVKASQERDTLNTVLPMEYQAVLGHRRFLDPCSELLEQSKARPAPELLNDLDRRICVSAIGKEPPLVTSSRVGRLDHPTPDDRRPFLLAGRQTPVWPEDEENVNENIKKRLEIIQVVVLMLIVLDSVAFEDRARLKDACALERKSAGWLSRCGDSCTTHNVVVNSDDRLLIRRPECKVKIDDHASFALRRVVPSEQDVVLGDVAMEDPKIVTDEPLMS